MKGSTLTLLAATLVISLNMTAVQADDDIQEIKAISEGLNLISLEEARTKALEAKPGIIDDIDLENRSMGRGWDYEFEIVDADGNEWEVYIDAKTGEVRKIDRDWF